MGCFCLILSGCRQELSQEEEDAAEKKPDTRWEERWDAVYTDDEKNDFMINMQMKCIIMVPENKPDSIVEVRETKIDSQYKERIVKTVFRDGAYLYDIRHMTKDALEEELADRREELVSCNEYIEKLEEDLEEWMEDLAGARKKKKFLKKKIKKIEACLRTAPAAPVLAGEGDYGCDSYLGYVDGIAYRLEFNGQGSAGGMVEWNGSGFEESQTVTLEPLDSRDAAPEEFAAADRIFYYGGHQETENRCSLTSGEALEKAEDFLGRLGLEHVVKTSEEDILWTDDTNAQTGILDGYRFFFQAGIDGIVFSNAGAMPSSVGEAFEEVCVTDRGVVAFRLNSPIEVKSITPDVELLDFQDVKDMLRTQMAGYIKEIMRYEKLDGITEFFSHYGAEIQIKKMELCYCRLEAPEKEGEYSYVPAWNLHDFMVINAIDGSFIGT